MKNEHPGGALCCRKIKPLLQNKGKEFMNILYRVISDISVNRDREPIQSKG
jgi:hypothetical protein